MTRPGSLLATVLFAAWPAFAQPPHRTESLQVFATRAPLLRADGMQAISVLTREEIDRRNAVTAAELLREIAGVHVDRLGGPGGAANVYIRGAEPNHTVVLVDGVRLNDPTDVRGGSYDLSSIAAEEVERIEVLRGASSAQFGADAMGGIVNIVTRRAAGTMVRARAGAGGQGYRAASAAASGAGARLGVQWLEDGRERDGGRLDLRALDASFASRWREEVATQIALRYAERNGRAFPESSGGVRLAVDRALEAREVREALGTLNHSHRIAERWRLSLTASALEREEERDTPAVLPGPGGFVPASSSSSRFRRTGALLQSSHDGLPLAGSVVAGVEAWREDGRRESVLRLDFDLPGEFRLVRDTRAAFLQLQAEPVARLRALAGVRHDDIDPGGSRRSHHAGLRYGLTANQFLRAHWSEGFKPPSFFALADPLVGNASLRPERARSREIGWVGHLGAARAEASLFETRHVDLVDFDPGTFRMVNRHRARMRGAELSVKLATAAGRIEGSYTYVDARLEPADARLRNRPRHRASLALGRDWGPWHARVAVVHVGRTFDFSVPTGSVSVASHTVVDLALTWRGDRAAVALAIDNALDRRYESFIGFRAPGARARVDVSITL